MSFWPFPKTLLDRMRVAAAAGACVELGAGTGDFRQRLREVGIDSIALDADLSSLRELDGARVAARVEDLPFASGAFGLMTLSNLLRHLAPDQRPQVLDCGSRHLAPGGVVVVLEDAVQARDDAERNYRECLRLLAQVDRSRGEVMDIDASLSSSELALVEGGRFENRTVLQAPSLPLRWMSAHSDDAALLEEVADLRRRVERWGMTVGQASYQVWGQPN